MQNKRVSVTGEINVGLHFFILFPKGFEIKDLRQFVEVI